MQVGQRLEKSTPGCFDITSPWIPGFSQAIQYQVATTLIYNSNYTVYRRKYVTKLAIVLTSFGRAVIVRR